MGMISKRLIKDKPKSIFVACIVFGILIMTISVGFAYFEISGPDKEGFETDFATLEEDYGVIGCKFEENNCLYITVKDEVWDAMDKDKKYRYMSELALRSRNILWDRNFVDYPKCPSNVIFQTSAGIVANAPFGDQELRIYR